MKSRPSIRTQILIFTLFGEYIVPRGGAAWTTSLLTLLGILEVSERATRSTLSRMRQKGWLSSERAGRFSRYSLTRKGRRVVHGGEIRIFEPRRIEWDGLWHMLVYSIPEGKRHIRADLRNNLMWMGFGHLAPGTWISPTNRREEVEGILHELKAKPYAVYFEGMSLHLVSNEEIVRRCWDLGSINSDYKTFLQMFKPAFEDCAKNVERGQPLSPAECFRQRFWLTLEYSQFPRRDPNLPSQLLPDDWLGTQASQMFAEFHELLREPSEDFVSEVLNSNPGSFRAQADFNL